LVDIRAPEQVAVALLGMLASCPGEEFRDLFVRHYTLQQHLARLAEAIRSAEHPPPAFAPELLASGVTR
jgi:hypothetical protein